MTTVETSIADHREYPFPDGGGKPETTICALCTVQSGQLHCLATSLAYLERQFHSNATLNTPRPVVRLFQTRALCNTFGSLVAVELPCFQGTSQAHL